MRHTTCPLRRHCTLRAFGPVALFLSLRAVALEPALDLSSRATLILSPRALDAFTGTLQLDVRLPFLLPTMRIVVAFSSTESAAIAPSCMFAQELASGVYGGGLTAVVGTTASSANCSTAPCAPVLTSTCGFSMQTVQVDGSSRYSGHVQVWSSNASVTARLFSGSLSLQIPLAKMMLAKKPLECLILVFCLDLVCCVLTPVKWVLPYLHAPPPPPPYPSAPLYSTLQFCSTQAGLNTTAFTPGSDGDVIYVSETYCFEQIVYNLPRDAVLVAHALYVNGTLGHVAAGTSALLITPSLLSLSPAAVRFEFTFPAAGVFVLDSASVFQLPRGNVSYSSASGGGSHLRNSPSRVALPPASAAVQSTVSMTQLAEFDISQAKASIHGLSVLGAALASKQVIVAAAPLSKRPPMSFATFKRAQR